MSYNFSCIEFFTPEQYNRMHFFWENYYESFFSTENLDCNLAFVSFDVDKKTTCVDEVVQFTNLSSSNIGLQWDFGDGTTSTDENPTHSYSDPGTYTVSLTIDGKVLNRQYLVGVDQNEIGRTLPFVEDFEDGEIPDGWIVDNVGFDFSLGWEVTNSQLYNCPGTNDVITGIDGNNTYALSTDNWSVANQTYAIITPPINLLGATILSFDYFYKEWQGWCPSPEECLDLKLYYKVTCSNEEWEEINEIYTAGSSTNISPKLSRGIVVHNSGEHGADVRDNILGDQTASIKGLGVALETQENNPALRFNCNRFSNNQQAVRLNPGDFTGSLANQSSECEAVTDIQQLEYFPENEYLSTVESEGEHLFADNLLLTAEGTPFRYFDNAKAIAPPDTDNGGVSQVLINNENYDNCLVSSDINISLFPDPSCDMGVTTGGGVICCKWPALDLDNPGLIQQGIENGIFRLALLEERTDELIDFLKENPTKERQKELFGLYLRQGQFTAARKVLEELPETEAPFREMGNWLVESAEKTEPTDSLRRHLPRLEALSKQNIPVAGTHPTAVAAQGLVTQLGKKRFDRWVVSANEDLQAKSGTSSQGSPKSLGTTLHEKVVKPKLYPNPATDAVTVEYDFEQQVSIKVIDVMGKELYHETVTKSTQHTFTTSNWNKGVYYLIVKAETSTYPLKLIVK